MNEKNYDPNLPRTIANLVHQYGLKSVISELAGLCEVEWIQACQRSEPAEHWRDACNQLRQVVEQHHKSEECGNG